MKDETYVFYEDVKEKAITARSSKKRPHRSGCKFPHRTAKEVRAMNGPTHTVNLKKAIPYADFKALPEDLQKEYVKNILAKYNVGITALAEVMGVPAATCATRLHRLGFYFQKGFKPDKADLARLREDYGLAEKAPTKKITLESVSFSFVGAFDPASFTKQLKQFMPDGQALRVSVVVEVVDHEPSTTGSAT